MTTIPTNPIDAEPQGDWLRPDLSAPEVPFGPVPPLETMSTPSRRGRRRDPLNLVSTDSAGTGYVAHTLLLTTNAAGQLVAGASSTIYDPQPVDIRSGFIVKRRCRLVAPVSGTALAAVLIGNDPNPGWPNAALLGAGAYDLELTDGDLYVSTAGMIGAVQASASGYLVVVNYLYDPGPVEDH
jgi:hypothetical protein